MSKHVWLQKSIGQATVVRGMEALTYAFDQCNNLTLSQVFVGYYLEAIRQKSCSWSAAEMWHSSHATGLRFYKGKNAANYLTLGKRVYSLYMAPLVGLAPDTPEYAFMDALKEDGLLEH